MHVSSFAKKSTSKKAIKVIEVTLHYKNTVVIDPETCLGIERYTYLKYDMSP